MDQPSLFPDETGKAKKLPRHKQLPLRERPMNRVLDVGAKYCTDVELLSTLVGGTQPIETAEKLLAYFKHDLFDLARAPVEEVVRVSGIGPQIAARLQAAIEVGRRLTASPEEKPIIHSPADAAGLVQFEMSMLEQEELRVILLDTRNRVMDIVTVYRGSLNSSQVRIGEVFKTAIRRNAAGVVVIHNHPSGDPTPSPDDITVTRAIVQAGKLVDISLLDHLIIGRGKFVSLRERGLGFDGAHSGDSRVGECMNDEVIDTYTRAQALADGVLVDVSEMAREAGFKFPTAITADLHARLETDETEKSMGQSYAGRLWDVLFMASFAARRSASDQASFEVLLVETGENHRLEHNLLLLWMVIGPGDNGEPVITIGFPQDF